MMATTTNISTKVKPLLHAGWVFHSARCYEKHRLCHADFMEKHTPLCRRNA